MTSRVYQYVGDPETAREVAGSCTGTPVASQTVLDDVLAGDVLAGEASTTVTFVVTVDGMLRVASRRSEHVACADGQPVLAAGELTFDKDSDGWRVVSASNQSTGYCPEPTSWPAVAAALDAAGVPHPGRYTFPFTFRRCETCQQRNLVKEDDFCCDVCGSDLPQTWNFS